ncbi:MAG: hypothetical protein N2109_10415 [Fimbriimonadales bacterium]|nr:hypothetical protein [Fimbriimonadales bacterium]
MPQSSSGGELGVKAAGPVAHTEGLRGCCDSDRKAQGRSLRRAASVFAQGWGIALPLRILDAVMVATDKARLWISKDGCIVAEQDSGLIAAGALPKNPGVEDGAIGQESRRIGPRVREVVHDRIEMETVE